MKKILSMALAATFAFTAISTPVYASNSQYYLSSKTTKNQCTVALNTKWNNKKNDIKDNQRRFIDSDELEWAMKAIEKLGAKGILKGDSKNAFNPKSEVTKLEALAMVLRLTGDEETAFNNNRIHPLYKGLKSSWGLGYIFVAIEKGILLPKELIGFNPNTPAKRHEIAKYLVRAIGKTDLALQNMNAELPFRDSKSIPKDSVGYVYVVNELKLMTGNKNEFQPMKPITRAEMAVLIERADQIIDNPDVDKNERVVSLISVDKNTNKISVKYSNNNTAMFDILPGVPVYKEGIYTNVDALKAGDYLSLIFNDNRQVIFIEYLKNAPINPGTEITFVKPADSEVPANIKTIIENLKLTENYQAFQYNNKIYLFASLGQKNTGGYAIDITKIVKNSTDNNKYNITAFVSKTEPGNGVVTQAVTYPYTIVKFAAIDNIDKINFVDKDSKPLAQTSIINLDEQTSVSGTIKSVDANDRKVIIMQNNNLLYQYIIPSNAVITLNGSNSRISELKEGMQVEITLLNGSVTNVKAIETVVTLTGILTNINLSENKSITVKVGDTTNTYALTSNTLILLDGKTATIEQFPINSEVIIKHTNNILIEIRNK